MKKPTKKTKTPAVEILNAASAPAGCSYRPAKPLEQILAEFIAKQNHGKKNSGENSVIPDFALAVRMLCHNYENQSFNFNNVLELTSHLQSPASALIPLWHEWVDVMREQGRLRQINIVGIPQYTFC